MALFDFFKEVLKVPTPTTDSKELGEIFYRDSGLIREITKEIINQDMIFKRKILQILEKWAKRKGINLKDYERDTVYMALRYLAKKKLIAGLFIGLIQ